MRDEPFVRVARALADPTRLQMLREIRAAGELTCSGVCCRFALSQPTISHHIKTLQEAGLIKIRREGQYHVLSVDDKLLAEFSRELAPRHRAAPAPHRPRAADAPAAPARRRRTKKTPTEPR